MPVANGMANAIPPPLKQQLKRDIVRIFDTIKISIWTISRILKTKKIANLVLHYQKVEDQEF